MDPDHGKNPAEHNCRKAVRTRFRFGRKKLPAQRGEDRSEIHHQHAWGVRKYCSYRELVMEDAAKKRLAIMPAKERLKEIRAAIADGL